MKIMSSALCLVAYAVAVPAASAQMLERPLPLSRPVGIVYPSEVGRTTSNTLQDDDVTVAAIAEVEQTIRQLGYQVISRADVIKQLIDAGTNCSSGVQNCAPADVLRTLKLGAVVLVAIWWDRKPADITIEVTTADATGLAKGQLDGDVGHLVPDLVTRALRDLKNGRAVDVVIHSVPLGAEVRLDGELIGSAPASAKARPGEHEAILSYPDYVTTSRHFEVPRGAEEPWRVDVTMERTPASAAHAQAVPLPPPTDPTPAWDYVLGGALGVAGAALVVSPILTVAQAGDCKALARNRDCERVSFGWQAGLQLAGGLLALSGAAVLFATTPIRASLSTDGESLHAQLHASF